MYDAYRLAVRRREVGPSSPSDLSPLWGKVDDFKRHEKLSAKKGPKLTSMEREYWRFCLQAIASIVVMVSFFVKYHCFGALLEFVF